jgi:hypothetical protein
MTFSFLYFYPAIISDGTVTITKDDECDIFDDDEEEDEAYMFAGQGICKKYRIAF